MSDRRVVVVGTTTDYIDEIRRSYPGRALFVTDPAKRFLASEPQPASPEELLCELGDIQAVWDALQKHMVRWKQSASGVAGFDCESLGLSAQLARRLALPFPSPEAVSACRNKFTSKQIWRRAGIGCPQAVLLRHRLDVPVMMARLPSPVVLKPLTGSGSELVFRCSTPAEAARAYTTIRRRLNRHPDKYLYPRSSDGRPAADVRNLVLAETFVPGREFSCDFLIDRERLQIIRTAAKIPDPGRPVGTTLAYVTPVTLPDALETGAFRQLLFNAARSLGLRRALCMADVMVDGDTPCFLEISPRPGGDCLPMLIRESCRLDMLGVALDFAEGKCVNIPPSERWEHLVGMRLFADTKGVLRQVHTRLENPALGVRSIQLKARPGHRIALPPDDYDSHILGHVIFKPAAGRSILEQCAAIRSRITVEMETNI